MLPTCRNSGAQVFAVGDDQPHGPARALFHGGHAAVMGQLFARLSTLSGKSQIAMVDGPAAKSSIDWPWSTASAFETRLHEILPESTVRYLEELGALKATAVGLSH
jgi:hypothetical protein